ncbi:LOW QUALITY PROTEIN: mitotic checkpoint serine/threonine-protein kinase BUB1 beta [Sceloporus undulatus]|uniref:LOW QUALITY PROTEIN: mitotic checkpoint serine/threonine-protein kinase BUB1 beta n=1 Tax=Sceloporus undulatus TaxID=8520 RepID=UPI001C4BE4AA|nr:LOW QUALITY PROTEIN: mitotic checkpoint serine/threonine-protein kinase BUB1 beta [Sceloporus undulatus]
MSLDENEWELSKENVQPLRQGRVMATLQEALAQQDVSTHTAIQQQKREFESEIRFYCGDDPLDVWDRYIKWTEQTFPQGGKESNLSAVLERAVKALNEQQRYYQDPRYLSLWLKFGNCCSEPLDLYSYLHSQGIGTSLAQLYVTWAEELEARGNYKKADLIFQDGVLCKAEPLDKLLSHHRQFQARVSRQTFEALEEDTSVEEPVGGLASEPQRTTLAELKGRGKKIVKAPVSRIGNAIKFPSQGQRLQTPSQQASNRPTFAVFDENRVVTSKPELPALVPQPWVAPPPVKAKENELKPGPWNMGRCPQSNMDSALPAPAMVPNFTPYVDESAQQQAMTPCKVEPSMNCVLSVRKPMKEEDPLHRVQNHQQDGQEKKEQPMYCKEKVYAGVDEFSFEEIRAEIYRKKAKKRREEELQTIAQKKAELQRKIEEMEKVVREQQEKHEQRSYAQHAVEQESGAVSPNMTKSLKPLRREEQCALTDSKAFAEGSPSDCFFLKSNLELEENFQHKKSSSSSDSDIPPALSASIPFSIFDESSAFVYEGARLSTGPLLMHARCPLAVRKPSESIVAKENIPPENSDQLHETEPLIEDAILMGSYKNKTLCPNPEDTCDFVRAAHLASTPFHGITEQRSQLDDKPKEECPESKTTLLSQKTVVNEDQYAEALFVKKLSPIMEASQEDTRSSASSTSPSQISIKFQKIPEKLELAHSSTDEIVSDAENGSNYSPTSMEQCKQLLQPLPELLTKSPDFILEAQPMPWVELEKELHLGNDIYCITREYSITENDKMFSALPANFAHEISTAFLIKVHSEPVPWDFYILLQLRERLGAGFDQNFSGNCTCFLYHNGCVTLHNEINCITLQDIICRCNVIPQEVVMLIVDNLLEVVQKLHEVEIVHGNLHPASLFLGDRICNPFAMAEAASALKLVDFSHSLDLKLQSGVSSLRGFPIAQTQCGQQILDEKSPPYQIDLLGIADTVHIILFGESLQVHQEKGYWKTNRDLSQFVDSDIMEYKFFEKILNANGEFTVPLLKELRAELSSCIWTVLSQNARNSLTKLEGVLDVGNIF